MHIPGIGQPEVVKSNSSNTINVEAIPMGPHGLTVRMDVRGACGAGLG